MFLIVEPRRRAVFGADDGDPFAELVGVLPSGVEAPDIVLFDPADGTLSSGSFRSFASYNE